jgi:hypothetical protein
VGVGHMLGGWETYGGVIGVGNGLYTPAIPHKGNAGARVDDIVGTEGSVARRGIPCLLLYIGDYRSLRHG